MPPKVKEYLFKRWSGSSNDSFKEFFIMGDGGVEDEVIQWFKDNGAYNPDGVLVKYWW